MPDQVDRATEFSSRRSRRAIILWYFLTTHSLPILGDVER